MYRFDKRYYATIAGHHVDFRVFRLSGKKHRKKTYQVDVAIRFSEERLSGGDIKIQLLDKNFLPLKKITSSLDVVELPSLTWAGARSVFKSDWFEQAAHEPCHLLISLFGKEMLFDIVKQAREDGIAPVHGGTTTTAPPKRPGPPPPRCCPNQFNTPNGNLPTTARNLPNAAGAVAAVSVICQPWVITASFNNAPPPCNCICCEYRQHVRGAMSMTPPGGGPVIDVSPVTDYQVPLGPVAPGVVAAPVAVKGLNAANFVEDTLGDRNQPGNPLNFGHRNNLGARPGGIHVPQDYPTPCSYWALDTPKGTFAPGSNVNINVTFRGQIIDTCNGNAVTMGPNLWQWVFAGVV